MTESLNKKNSVEQKSKDPKWLVWIVVVLLPLIGVLSKRSNSLPHSTTKFEAPQFTLTDIEGRSLSLSHYRGKVVILNFWAPWCPLCRREISNFISLQIQYGGQGLQIIGIGLDQPNDVASFVRQHGINYPVAVGDDAIANLLGGISGIPTTYIIDKQGNIINKYEGFTTRTIFEEEIKKLL